jgi:predicted DNA-binding protein (UPF0251 family)
LLFKHLLFIMRETIPLKQDVMLMKKLRLLCISPYEGMFNLMTNIAAQRSDVELIIHMGNLDGGLQAVLENRDADIDAVLSRGGTTETIRQHCDIPVCDITPSVYDVLRTIRLAQGTLEPFAVVGYPSITKPADMLRDIMQYDFQVKAIHSAAECEAQLEALRGAGIRMIVGDMISVTCAQKLGMNGLLIVSGIESAEAAIDSAKAMYRYYDTVGRRAALFNDLLCSDDVDTVIYTSGVRECFSSTHDLPEEIVRLLEQTVANVIAQGSVKLVRHLGTSVLTIRGRFLRSGGEEYCVYQLTKASGATMLDKYMIRYLSAESDFPDSNPLEYYLGTSAESSAVQAACDRYAAMNTPVLLVGARGTGKDRFAHYIYAHSRLKHSSLVVIDASLLDEKGWDFLLKSNNSPLTDSGLSIYFHRMHTATPAQQHLLIVFLKNSRVLQSNRLYFSYSAEPGSLPKDELFLYLTETLHCLLLQTPPLSQRRDDIPSLVGLYINAINVQNGTRVIGLTRDAMLLLQNHSWSRNVDQLVQVVRDLVINARTSYISEEEVAACLQRENCKLPVQQEASIDLNHTLDEITREIVLRVYESENMNQTHTAQRLGISRSTLWRMLK